MNFFDSHIHMLARTTDDYENMSEAGIIGVVEPAFWLGQPRTQAGSFIDYFNALIGWETFRASQFGIHHYATIGINPKEVNNVAMAEEVMKFLPRYCVKDNVVAVGEIGFDDITDAEDRFFAEQLELAKELDMPALVHTPHRDKKTGTERTLALVKEVGINPELVLIDHLNEITLPMVLDSGCWRGHSVYPDTKMSESRMVALLQQYGLEKMVVNSAADWGKSDPLKVPKTAKAMLAAGFTEEQIEKVLFYNPIEYYAQSDKISVEDVLKPIAIDQQKLWEENSVLRGQAPLIQ